MEMVDVKGCTLSELEELLTTWGESAYRARQLYEWLHKHRAFNFTEMTSLSRGLRERLEGSCVMPDWRIVSRQSDADEGTVKYLFELADGAKIEAVYMPGEGGRRTLCLSTQVGCRFRCRICLTGELGFLRNLTASEILHQIDLVSHDQGQPLTNIVYMGMGEPLDNYEAVQRSLFLLSEPAGRSFSLRRVTISTIGLVQQVAKLLASGLVPNFTFSLNAASDEVRKQIMPSNSKYPFAEIIMALRELPLPPRRRFTVAYVLLAGVNDSVADAIALTKLLHPKRVKINLIPFNEHAKLAFKSPKDDIIAEFQDILIRAGFSTFLRHSRGLNIRAACGQLAAGTEDDSRT